MKHIDTLEWILWTGIIALVGLALFGRPLVERLIW